MKESALPRGAGKGHAARMDNGAGMMVKGGWTQARERENPSHEGSPGGRAPSVRFRRRGAVAQLGERMTGSHEVRGSIPLSSTKRLHRARSDKVLNPAGGWGLRAPPASRAERGAAPVFIEGASERVEALS